MAMASEQIHTYCAMCVSRCGVVATLEDGRFDKVSVDPEHPNGCICIKGTAAPEIVYSPDRLRHPMVRTRPKGDPDPGWVPISWDEALAMAAARLTDIKERDGAEAVVFGRATPAGNATADLDSWLTRFASAFGSPNNLTTTHICTRNRNWGMKHTYGVFTPSPDLDHANCILLWGNNPQATEPAAAARISRAGARGAKLIVIDPRKHALAGRADCWLRVRPGSDGALALAKIHVLLEEELLDEAFARDWTNGPFLVREDTRALLTARDLSLSGDPASFTVWDSHRDVPVAWHPESGYADDDVVAALWGRFECRLADGTLVGCRPVVEVLKDVPAPYAPERSSEIAWVAADDVRRAVRMFAGERCVHRDRLFGPGAIADSVRGTPNDRMAEARL